MSKKDKKYTNVDFEKILDLYNKGTSLKNLSNHYKVPDYIIKKNIKELEKMENS